MKLADARETYYTQSAKASDVARQLGFAGIAIIWIFNKGADDQVALPSLLIWAGLFIAIGLAADFLHYALAAAIWGAFHRMKERAGTPEDLVFLAPRQLNWPASTLFWLKLTFILIGYMFIILHLVRELGS